MPPHPTTTTTTSSIWCSVTLMCGRALGFSLVGSPYAIELMSSAVMLQWMRQLRVLLLFPTIAPSVREPRASPNPSRDVWGIL